jgi:indolepyruvate ferredoxin oxidoreductase
LAVKLLGDAVYANPIMLGFAYQKGWIPLHHQSLQRAIELNGVQIELNLRAFNIGRLAVHDAAALVSASVSTGSDISDPPNALPDNPSLEQLLAHRSPLLMNYQSKAYASRYQGFVKEVAAAEQKACGTETLAQAVASALFKLMAYKDEYEVARLYSDGEFIRKIDAQFEGDWSLRFYLAPPLLAKRDSQGVLLKKSYSAKMMLAFKFLARLKFLRGTALDPFGYTAERRHERELVARYQAAIRAILPTLSESTHANALALAKIPEGIRGFGHVKAQAMHEALETFKTVERGGQGASEPAHSSPAT